MNISFYPEYIFKIGSFSVSNTLICNLLASVILIISAIFIRARFKKIPKPKSLQNIFEAIIEWIFKFINSITRSPKLTEKIFPLITTFFIFIATANLLGLLPGFLGSFFVKVKGEKLALLRSPNSDLNSTLGLAIVSVVCIQYFGIRFLGLKRYLKRFFNFANPIKWLVGLFELLSDFTKMLSLSLRLFGNVLAGEVLLLVVGFFIPYFIPLPFMILEIFVGLIQAFIFSTLSLVFIETAQKEF